MAPKRAREEAAPTPVAKAAKPGGGASAQSAALSREAEEEILRQRLLAKETSLRNLTKRYLSFAAAIESSTTEECEKLYQGLLKELAAYEFGMAKAKNLVAVNVQQVASYESMEGEIGAEMARTAAEIESLSRQLEEERTLRQQKEQYAALARRIQQLPPRAATEREIASLNVELVRGRVGWACLNPPPARAPAHQVGPNGAARSHAVPAFAPDVDAGGGRGALGDVERAVPPLFRLHARSARLAAASRARRAARRRTGRCGTGLRRGGGMRSQNGAIIWIGCVGGREGGHGAAWRRRHSRLDGQKEHGILKWWCAPATSVVFNFDPPSAACPATIVSTFLVIEQDKQRLVAKLRREHTQIQPMQRISLSEP